MVGWLGWVYRATCYKSQNIVGAFLNQTPPIAQAATNNHPPIINHVLLR